MDCGQVQSLFTAYDDGELDQRNVPPFERHLTTCPHCLREWQDFQKTLHLLQTAKPLSVPPDLLAGIHEKLDRGRFGLRFGRFLQKIFAPVPLTAAASVMAAALVAIVAVQTHIAPGPETTAVAPPARMAQAERATIRQPPLVTLPVSLGRPGAEYPQAAPRLVEPEPNSYYQFLLEREEADLSLLATWQDQFLSTQDARRHAAAPSGWQFGQPLVPDVTIRMHHLSPEGLQWLHSRIKEEGRWQTRLYPHDYFLVLVNPGELSALYHLLRRQHLFFSSHSRPEAERAPEKPLLIAVRP